MKGCQVVKPFPEFYHQQGKKKYHGNKGVSIMEKINSNGNLRNISTETYYFLIYNVSKPIYHPSGNVSGRRCDGNALNAEQQILFVNLRTIHQPKSCTETVLITETWPVVPFDRIVSLFTPA